MRAADISDRYTGVHVRDGIVSDRGVTRAGNRSKDVPRIYRGTDHDSGDFDADRVVDQARVHGALAHRDGPWPAILQTVQVRSEERRVGKECRSRWSPYH